MRKTSPRRWQIATPSLAYRWAEVVPGFDMPVKVTLNGEGYTLIRPTEEWKNAEIRLADPGAFKVDENFYVLSKNVSGS